MLTAQNGLVNLTLIAWTQLTPNYSAVISDSLVWTTPELSSKSPNLPSDTVKPKAYKSTELGNFSGTLTPKCYVIHPHLAVAFAGSKFIADSLFERLTRELPAAKGVETEYVDKLCEELDDLNGFSYILAHINIGNRKLTIRHHRACKVGVNGYGHSYVATGSGDWVFEEDIGSPFSFEHIDEEARSEIWLAEMRGLSIVHAFSASEYITERNLNSLFGGVFDCLFIDHRRLCFYAKSDYWQTYLSVVPISPTVRNYYPKGPFVHHLIDSTSKSLILDLFLTKRQTSRGFLCWKKRFASKRRWADYRNVLPASQERWLTTYNVVFGRNCVGSFSYLDQQGDHEKPWLKRKSGRNGFEFVFRGYRMERGMPDWFNSNSSFQGLLNTFPDFHDGLYQENSAHTKRRWVSQNLKRK